MTSGQTSDLNDIRYGVEQRVATITFARPDVLNAMTVDLIAETMTALDTAAQDREA